MCVILVPLANRFAQTLLSPHLSGPCTEKQEAVPRLTLLVEAHDDHKKRATVFTVASLLHT